jgi:general secretion pathway protein N
LTFRFTVVLVLVAMLAAAATVLVRAPAAWVGDWLQAHGRLRLLDARGTVWSGSAMLALSDGRRLAILPGRIAWRIDVASLAAGRLFARIDHPWSTTPLAVSAAAAGVSLNAGSAQLPASSLAALGAPFNTIRPGGVLDLRWTDLALRGEAFAGDMQIDWRDAQSALSSVAPLGSYRVRISAGRVRLETVSGPLHLEGSGTLRGLHLSFRGVASAEPQMRPALNGLLGVLGPRSGSGDNVLLALET